MFSSNWTTEASELLSVKGKTEKSKRQRRHMKVNEPEGFDEDNFSVRGMVGKSFIATAGDLRRCGSHAYENSPDPCYDNMDFLGFRFAALK